MSKQWKNNRRRISYSYFSLMEVMIAVAIIALLAGIAAPAYMSFLEKGKQKAAKAQISNFKTSINAFYLDTSSYPKSLADLVTNNGSKKWDGPYMEVNEIPKDPWNNAYVYTYPGTNGTFDIVCYGADGSPGGTGKGADINSWDN